MLSFSVWMNNFIPASVGFPSEVSSSALDALASGPTHRLRRKDLLEDGQGWRSEVRPGLHGRGTNPKLVLHILQKALPRRYTAALRADR